MRSITISKYVEVDIDIEDIETEDLIDELESRNRGSIDGGLANILNDIAYFRKKGKNDQVLMLVDKLIYSVLGRIV